LQQRRQYFDPAFIPIRRVTITGTHVNGTQHIVEFEIGDLVTLRPDGAGLGHLADPVRNFTALIRQNVPATDMPYKASIGCGASVLDSNLVWDGAAEMADIFEQATGFLAGTNSFRETRFVRFDSILQTGQTVWSEFGGKEEIELIAGQTYQLRLVHYQPEPVADRQGFTINVGEDIVAIIGEPKFEIASRYDEIRITLHPQPVPGIERRNTILVIEPNTGVDGPRIELPLQIMPSTVRTVTSVLAPVVVLAAIGLPSALNAGTTLKVALVVVGVLAAGVLQLFGIGLPSVASPFPAPAPSQSAGADSIGKDSARQGHAR
jgi:hypothetical protein